MATGEVLRSTIEQVLRVTLAPAAIETVNVVEDTDHDGRPVLFVTVLLPSDAGLLPDDRFLDAMTAASDAVLRLGDEREPLFRTVRHGEGAPLEDLDAVR